MTPKQRIESADGRREEPLPDEVPRDDCEHHRDRPQIVLHRADKEANR